MSARGCFFHVSCLLVLFAGIVGADAYANEQYLLFICHLNDPGMTGDVKPGTVELYTDLTKDPKVLRNGEPKAGLFVVDVLQDEKLLTKMAIPAVLRNIPVAATTPLTRARGKLIADVNAPYSGANRHAVRFEVETDAQGTPIRAYETDLKNGAKMVFACQWAPMIR